MIIYNLGDAVLIADRWFTKYGFWAILVLRLIPFMITSAITYGAGLTNIKFKSYIVPTVLGGLPRAFLLCYLGAQLLMYLNYATFGNPYTWFFIIMALIVVLIVAVYEFLIKRKYLKQQVKINGEQAE
ncbi:MAG: VTT domain-containing protein [Candidatus Jordarchaeum sp.]|uniref:VTT domain-containing protein n=1 Tax=Candidatus Jordarchaeum sp. TaxID=2823881 RepID=UPI00404AE456